MRKRTVIIITAAILVIVAAILCFAPRITRFDQVMTAVKLDAQGNQLGTTNFRVQASKYDYLFRDSRFSCWIPDFDTLRSFERKESVSQNTQAYCFTVIGVVTSSDSYVILDLYASPNLDRWLLWNQKDGTYYVASSDPELTAAELVSYFQDLSNKITIADIFSSNKD